jgi:hypothetical protein
MKCPTCKKEVKELDGNECYKCAKLRAESYMEEREHFYDYSGNPRSDYDEPTEEELMERAEYLFDLEKGK